MAIVSIDSDDSIPTFNAKVKMADMGNTRETLQSRMDNIFAGDPSNSTLETKSKTALIVALDDSLISGVGRRGESLFHYPTELIGSTHHLATAVLAYSALFDNFADDWPEGVARISNVTASIEGPDHLDKKPIVSVDQAIEAADSLDLSAISLHYNHTSPTANEQIAAYGPFIDAAATNDLPTLIHAYPRTMKRRLTSPWHKTEYHYRERPGEHTSLDQYTRLVMHAASVAINIGGNIIKLPYIDDVERLSEVVYYVQSNKAKIVIAGGPKVSVSQFLKKVHTSREAGVDGIAVGRNYFLQPDGPNADPVKHGRRVLEAAAHILYQSDATVESALELIRS
jgi:2-amino-4,5-dihydroxy-6-oxo-7-(phosphonooxy)heptanoate synthase